VANTSETPFETQWTTWRHIPEDDTFPVTAIPVSQTEITPLSYEDHGNKDVFLTTNYTTPFY
jgi:hypothetical protein